MRAHIFEKIPFSRNRELTFARRSHFLETSRTLLQDDRVFSKPHALICEKMLLSRDRSHSLETARVHLREDAVFSKRITLSRNRTQAFSRRSRFLINVRVRLREDVIFCVM